MSQAFMLDTTVFNHILRDEIDPTRLPKNARFFVTHVQLNELQATQNVQKRELLLTVFHEVPSERVPTESAMFGVSEWNEAKWGIEDRMFEGMLASLNGRNASKDNNGRDILIAETAIRNGHALVTDDRALAEVVREFGGVALPFQKLLHDAHAC